MPDDQGLPAGTPEQVVAWLEKAPAPTLAALQAHLIERQEAIEIQLDQAAKDAIAAILDERGKTIEDLYGWRKPQAKKKKTRRTAPTAVAKQTGPVYKDPISGETAKTPRGQPKAWLAAHLEAGFKLEEFEVQEDGTIGRPAAKTWRVDGDRLTSDPA